MMLKRFKTVNLIAMFSVLATLLISSMVSAQSALLSIDGNQFQTKTVGGAYGSAWCLWSDGYLEQILNFPSAGTYTFQVQAWGDLAGNVWPQMEIRVDQQVVQALAVDSSSTKTFSIPATVTAGTHKIEIAFTNDYYLNGQDRNLYVQHVNVSGAAAAPSYSLSISSPAANATVSGSVQIKGTGPGFKNVEVLKADGTLLARATPDASGNFAAAVDSAKLSNGSQTLTIDAWDAPAGQSFTHSDEKKLTVNVQNGTAPAPTPTYTLSITSPAANATVSGTMSLKGTGPGLKNVEIFSSSGALLARTTPDASGAFTASIDTTKFNNGSQTLTIDAWDAPAGQSFTHSDEKKLTVNVQNAAAQQTQALQLATPNLSAQAGGSLSFTTQFNAVPMDKSYVVFVHFVNSSGANAFGADYSPSPATTQWSGLVTSQRTVTVPSNLAAGTYSVRVGLYENVAPYTNRAKLALGPGVTQDNENRYIVGTLTVKTASGTIPAGTIIDYYGDSTIWGYKSGVGSQVATPAPAAFAQALPGVQVRNEGVSGTTACQLLNGQDGVHSNWDTQMANSNATVVIINHAINDEWKYDMATYKSCLANLAQKAKARGKKVIFETPNPTRDSYPSGLDSWAQAMRDVAAQQGAPVIEQYQYLKDYLGGRDVTTICPDGLHPTEDVYIMKGKHAAEVFKTLP